MPGLIAFRQYIHRESFRYKSIPLHLNGCHILSVFSRRFASCTSLDCRWHLDDPHGNGPQQSGFTGIGWHCCIRFKISTGTDEYPSTTQPHYSLCTNRKHASFDRRHDYFCKQTSIFMQWPDPFRYGTAHAGGPFPFQLRHQTTHAPAFCRSGRNQQLNRAGTHPVKKQCRHPYQPTSVKECTLACGLFLDHVVTDSKRTIRCPSHTTTVRIDNA